MSTTELGITVHRPTFCEASAIILKSSGDAEDDDHEEENDDTDVLLLFSALLLQSLQMLVTKQRDMAQRYG